MTYQMAEVATCLLKTYILGKGLEKDYNLKDDEVDAIYVNLDLSSTGLEKPDLAHICSNFIFPAYIAFDNALKGETRYRNVKAIYVDETTRLSLRIYIPKAKA